MPKSDKQFDAVVPIWLHFKPSWYKKLNTIAQECGMSVVDVIDCGVKLVLKQHCDEQAAADRGGQNKSAQEQHRRSSEASNRAGAALVRHRWLKMTQEEKAKMGREMARKRWAKQSKQNQ